MLAKRWIELRYKCSCMAAERAVQVPERGNEEIEDFMRYCAAAVTRDHVRHSALCMAHKFEYLKIPVAGDKVGGAEGGTA